MDSGSQKAYNWIMAVCLLYLFHGSRMTSLLDGQYFVKLVCHTHHEAYTCAFLFYVSIESVQVALLFSMLPVNPCCRGCVYHSAQCLAIVVTGPSGNVMFVIAATAVMFQSFKVVLLVGIALRIVAATYSCFRGFNILNKLCSLSFIANTTTPPDYYVLSMH